MRVLKFHILVSIAVLVLALGGCYYDEVIFPAAGEVLGDVSFSADIIPIFSKDCSISGCHATGGQKPDLSSANAYNSLSNGGYINISFPEESEVYLWMKGLKTVPMPLSGSNASYTANVLAWIKQGAQNN
jgi:hypothetical protein